MSNLYVTVRYFENENDFFVNVINYDGSHNTIGQHSYKHKRSARRAAIALAKKLDASYRQDLEYSDTPQAFIALATA